MQSRTRKALLVIVILCISILGTSCGSEKGKVKPDRPREVTSNEAALFAQILKQNNDLKNAKFTVSPDDKTQTNFFAEGVVDWANSKASISASQTENSSPEVSTVSTKEIVYETYPGLEEIQRQEILAPKKWVSRIISEKLYAVDAVSQFVITLSAPNADNPLLIKQDSAQFLGTQKFQGDKVSLFKKKDGDTIYYVSDQGLLKAVNLTLKGFTAPMFIIFSDHGKNSVEIPDSGDVYELDEVKSYLPNRPNL